MARMGREAQRENKGCLGLVFLVLGVRRASVVCASRPRSVADPPASNCLTEQEASQAYQALQVHPDLQVSELMANGACQVLLV